MKKTNEDQWLEAQRAEFEELHVQSETFRTRSREAASAAAMQAWRAGKILLEIKAKLGPGRWLPWFEKELLDVYPATIYHYRDLAAAFATEEDIASAIDRHGPLTAVNDALRREPQAEMDPAFDVVEFGEEEENIGNNIFASSLSEREWHDRIVALAGQVTWIRAVGGSVLRAEMAGDDPLLQVKEDPLFRGFNEISGLSPDMAPPVNDFDEWIEGQSASWIRRMTIAQTGARIARGVAVSGFSPLYGCDPNPGYDTQSSPGLSIAGVRLRFCSRIDDNLGTGPYLDQLIEKRVQSTLLENWLCVQNLSRLIFYGKPRHLIERALECQIEHPFAISAKIADEMWRDAKRAMIDDFPA